MKRKWRAGDLSSGKQCLLLFQKTEVQFSAFTLGSSQLLVTNSTSRASDDLFSNGKHVHVCVCAHTQRQMAAVKSRLAYQGLMLLSSSRQRNTVRQPADGWLKARWLWGGGVIQYDHGQP